jgi:hypothetical protein
MPEISQQRGSRKLQFSLRTCLLAIVFLAVALTSWIAYRQAQLNRRLNEENQRLRQEAGELDIEPGHEDELHTLRLLNFEPLTWKWKMYVPAGRRFYLHAVGGDIPGVGSGSGEECVVPLETGTILVVLHVRRDHNGQLQWMIGAKGERAQIPVSSDIATLINAKAWTHKYIDQEYPQAAGNPTQPWELLRCRTVSPKDSSSGILMWISGEANINTGNGLTTKRDDAE